MAEGYDLGAYGEEELWRDEVLDAEEAAAYAKWCRAERIAEMGSVPTHVAIAYIEGEHT